MKNNSEYNWARGNEFTDKLQKIARYLFYISVLSFVTFFTVVFLASCAPSPEPEVVCEFNGRPTVAVHPGGASLRYKAPYWYLVNPNGTWLILQRYGLCRLI